MRAVGPDLTLLTDELVEEVRRRGMAADTVEEYRCACNGLLRFAAGRDEGSWTPGLASEYLRLLDDRLGRGDICPGYHRFQLRVVRLIASLAETGAIDFSPARGREEKYPVDGPAASAVEGILDAKCASEGSRRDLGAPVRHLLWYAAGRGVAPLEIDDELVMDFLVREVPSTNAGSTGRALRAVRYATEWLREHGGRVLRDYSMLTLRNEARRIIPAFTEAEIRAVVDSIDAATDQGKRDRAIVLVAYCTGLRAGDVLGLRLSEVDWRNQRLTTSQSKTHEPITCELNGETMNALADYVLEARPESDAPEVFLTVHAPHRAMGRGHLGPWFDALCERVGVEKVPGRSFHSLRRSFETVMVSRGVGIEVASQMVGHRTIAEDKPYITHDAATASLVAMGFGDCPITAGAYAAGGGGST